MELGRLQLDLERYRKWYYGPRADRIRSSELAQMLLEFSPSGRWPKAFSWCWEGDDPAFGLRRIWSRAIHCIKRCLFGAESLNRISVLHCLRNVAGDVFRYLPTRSGQLMCSLRPRSNSLAV
jgi:hypothetical protein